MNDYWQTEMEAHLEEPTLAQQFEFALAEDFQHPRAKNYDLSSARSNNYWSKKSEYQQDVINELQVKIRDMTELTDNLN